MNSVLTDINEKIETQLKSISVNKVIDPQFGLKDLVVFDGDQISFKLNEREKLDALARDNAQLIFNQLFDRKKLERSVIEDAIVVELPERDYDGPFACPREKPLPKKKAMTKWEAFAKQKGINAKKKKSRMVWCEVTKSWKPRWGYMSAKKAKELNKNGESKDWVREVKDGEDAEVDPWTKEKRDKKERVDKNEMARLKNIARNMKGFKKESKEELRTSFRRAKKSTASLGSFDKQVEGEKKEKIGGKRK
jgi:regulator of ribosome biosynthesis